jgi:hypothetical protein
MTFEDADNFPFVKYALVLAYVQSLDYVFSPLDHLPEGCITTGLVLSNECRHWL